ncbi:hypothetical protein SBRCBS47491_002748 [Sporothrix bragantina]|uniref:Zn(2)-C6 fungal-type domain-containing protein n=1 Tax=Sporothrix bragantina TaxID=671064 RepID=A0ABP0B9E3_9PEZI
MVFSSASRACKGCSQLKVRCKPSPIDANSCERCLHAGRECIRADKRRRPRDRIAELEAQVAALSRALQKQQLSSRGTSDTTSTASDNGDTTSSPSATSNGPDAASISTRNAYSFSTDKPLGETAMAFLDARISLATQQRALDLYAKRYWSMIPAFALDSPQDQPQNLDRMREEKPVLFFSIITFTAPASLLSADSTSSTRLRTELLREAMCMFAVELISKPNRRLDTVWSLLIACFWFRAQHGSAHVTVHQLTQMAASMAIDLGIGGNQVPAAPGSASRSVSTTDTSQAPGSTGSTSSPATTASDSIELNVTECSVSPGNSGPACPYGSKIDADRAWLACFMSASNLAIGIRRPDTSAQWTPYHDQCLENLTRSEAHTMGDSSLFLHMVRGERLCQQVVDAVRLCEPTVTWDLTSAASQQTTAAMQTAIDNWTAETTSQIFSSVTHANSFDYKIILFYRHAAVIYLHEPVLHSATNKLTFGAPFRREKLAENDFAAPAVVTGKHVASLYALKDACLALLDLATTPEDNDNENNSMTAFLADCPLSFIAKVFHAFFVLVKLHIAVTGPGNTYGTILRPGELRLAQYPERLLTLSQEVEKRNPGSFHYRILGCGASSGAGEWFTQYEAARARGWSTQTAETLPTSELPPSEMDADYFLDTNTASSSDNDMAAYLAAAYGQGSTDIGGFDVDDSQWQMLDRYLSSFNAPP